MMLEIISTQDEIAQKKKAMDADARRLAEDNVRKAFLAAKAQADALRKADMADAIDMIRKQAIERYDEKGRAITKQDIFLDKLKSVMGSEQSSIHDWKSSMMSLMSVLSAFVAATNQDVNELTAPYIVPLTHALKNGIIDMKDTLLDKLRGDPRVDLPTLVHDVKIGPDNRLAVKLHAGGEAMPLKDRGALVEQWLNERGLERDPNSMSGFITKEGQPVSQELVNKLKNDPNNGLDAFLNRASVTLPQGLRTLVALWLNERGYEIDPNNAEAFRTKEGHVPLTAAAFNELKYDQENGLNEFLNRASEVQYREELEEDGPSSSYGMAF
jgi:hypothetical protein